MRDDRKGTASSHLGVNYAINARLWSKIYLHVFGRKMIKLVKPSVLVLTGGEALRSVVHIACLIVEDAPATVNLRSGSGRSPGHVPDHEAGGTERRFRCELFRCLGRGRMSPSC